MLERQTIETIKQTIPVLVSNGEDLTRHFYKRMFTHDPQVQTLFNPAHQHVGSQQKALAAAICAYAQHIENPGVLADALELIAQKHASLGIKPEHYPIVGKHLLGSIQEVLGSAATPQIIDAWGQAYQFLADVLIAREAEIYAQHRQQHGWEGFRPFVIRRKVRESDVITSFYLEPTENDGGNPRELWFQAGQFVTVRVPSGNTTTMRNYSLSCEPGLPYYRISVKREPALTVDAPAGYVSNYLHNELEQGDVIELGPPCGQFVLDEQAMQDTRPLVLISGGVGITPMLSMLHAALARESSRPIWFIHGAIRGATHAFGPEVRELAAAHPRLQVHIRYSEPTQQDVDANRCDSQGMINTNLLDELLDGPDAAFYFCGPKPLLVSLYQGLSAWGVKPEDLHYEFFGPAEQLEEPAESVAAGA